MSFGESDIGLLGTLHKLDMTAISNQDCRASNPNLAEKLENSHFCGKAPENTGPCQGDSGGGFLFYYNDKWHLQGILSASLVENPDTTCDLENNSIFINILHYLSWIPKGTELPKVSTSKPSTETPPIWFIDTTSTSTIITKPTTTKRPKPKPVTQRPSGSDYPTEASFIQRPRDPPPRRDSDEWEG